MGQLLRRFADLPECGVSADYTKPLPAVSNLNRPYWEGLVENELPLQRCDACERAWYPPGPWCPVCWSKDFTWRALSGRGQVSSWVVFHQAYFPSFADEVPYNVAEVELDEGPRLLTNLIDVEADQIRIGLPVEVVYDPVAEGVTLARFRPLGG